MSGHLDVAVVHRRLPHYRLPLYDGLVRDNPDLRLTVYCGDREGGPETSGVAVSDRTLPYVKSVRNRRVRWGRTELIFQPATVAGLLRHSPDVVVFEGRVLLLSSLPLMIWRRLTGRMNIIWLKGWPDAVNESGLSRLTRRAYLRLGHYYIVYGESSIARLGAYGVPADRITVAQNTVDVATLLAPPSSRPTAAEAPAVQAVLDRGNFLLTVGRLVKRKAVADLLEAFAKVAGGPEGAALSLAIVGRGPELEPLRARAAALGLQDRVVFTGPVSDPDAELLFQSARCCIFTGAVGLSLNQALAAGRPVICADEWGPDAELLVHEETGLRFRKGDVGALADTIRRLLADPALATALAQRGREKVRGSATMDNMIARYSGALRRAAGQRTT